LKKAGNMKPQTILIRADAGAEIGTGHVMRCLALAQAWQDAGGRAVFALAESTPAIHARLSTEGFECPPVDFPRGSSEDANYTLDLARVHAAEWIVADGYEFNAAYQQTISNGGGKLLFVDDTGEGEFYSANVVLNQNSNASEGLYRARCPQTKLLLGTQFALLRREFTKWTGFARGIPLRAGTVTVLVSLGGSDPSGLTGRIVQSGAFSGFETTFLWGDSSRKQPESGASAGATHLVDQSDMPGIMARTDISIICGGGTLWESLFMGCATLSYSRSPIQEAIIRQLHEAGRVRWLGDIDDFDPQALADAIEEIAASVDRRIAMQKQGRQLVDGKGAQRVLFALQQWT
jgi:UDP-2,4-diacetamido-2,4,6-trideoxy-beta-L-altropyranose hydrolase